jgi:hypothetical protein
MFLIQNFGLNIAWFSNAACGGACVVADDDDVAQGSPLSVQTATQASLPLFKRLIVGELLLFLQFSRKMSTPTRQQQVDFTAACSCHRIAYLALQEMLKTLEDMQVHICFVHNRQAVIKLLINALR